MASQQAQKDDNAVSSLIGVLNTDGRTTIKVIANPDTHRLKVRNGVAGSNAGGTNAGKDENMVSSLIAVSSSDGSTIVPIYCDADGYLLIQNS